MIKLSLAAIIPERPLLAIAILGALFVFGWAWTRWFESSQIFFPEREITFLPSHVGLKYEDVIFPSQDQSHRHGWFIPGSPGELTILFCHGNGGNISHRVEKIRRWSSLGVNIFIFDYAGYGRSDGRPSELETYRDAQKAYLYLLNVRRISPQKIVVYGESLGAAVALEAVLHQPARALIMESPFTSIPEMARHLLPWLPVRFMIRYRYDSLSKISRVKVPLLILHSPQDEIVPYKMGRALFDAAQTEKVFFDLRGGHNDGYETSGQDYIEIMRKFLNHGPS